MVKYGITVKHKVGVPQMIASFFLLMHVLNSVLTYPELIELTLICLSETSNSELRFKLRGLLSLLWYNKVLVCQKKSRVFSHWFQMSIPWAVSLHVLHTDIQYRFSSYWMYLIRNIRNVNGYSVLFKAVVPKVEWCSPLTKQKIP